MDNPQISIVFAITCRSTVNNFFIYFWAGK